MFAQHALIRRPSSRLADGIVTHLERSPVDVEKARTQWQAYVDALHAAGWETHEVDPAEEHPDSVFVEDTMLVYGDLAVIARPGAEERRGETPALPAVLTLSPPLKFSTLTTCTAPWSSLWTATSPPAARHFSAPMWPAPSPTLASWRPRLSKSPKDALA